MKNSANVSLVDINKEMKDSYLQYSMSVIVGRALPDVRDGLKPVHRRILYAMKDLNNTHNRPFKKSARVVGDVIGKYHPHGDMAVYDAIVRMAQDFSMQAPLIDGQGNFGSIDGDSPAASRYTEIRMTALAEELLVDIDKKTVPFSPNYDDSLLIPSVLPAKYPNLLVNGSEGIAVGMACKIPPHNLSEVVSACVAVLENPDIDIKSLMEYVPGPDFPTSGIIEGRQALHSAYSTGKGIITISSVAQVEERRIVVTQIPYQVNKARLIESIAQLVKDKKISGISDIRDESSKEGLRIVIMTKKDANAQIVLNQIQKHSQLRISFGIIFLALNKNNQPQLFNLKQMLSVFITHRLDIITRRLIFDLRKATERLHILEGLKKALSVIDKVISTIRSSKNVGDARKTLISSLDFSHRQATAILEMKLQKLTHLEIQGLNKECRQLEDHVKYLKETLASEEKIKLLLRGELIEIKEKYSRPRRTKIIESTTEIIDRDLILRQDVVLFLTYKGQVKRIPLGEYRLQKRGGKGLKGWELKTQDDFVWKLWSVNTLDRLLVFSSLGRLHFLDVYRVPSGFRQTKARSLNNLLSFKTGEEAKLVLPLKESFGGDGFLSTITRRGIIKTSLLKLFKPRSGGVNALSIDKGDSLQDVQKGLGPCEFLIYTVKGLVIRIPESSVRHTGKTARGVRAVRLQPEDFVASMEVVYPNQEAYVIVITQKGYGKRVKISEFRLQQRGGRGVLGQKITQKTGDVVAARCIDNSVKQLLITTNQGQSIRFLLSDVPVLGRVSQGVRFINLKNRERVTGATLVTGQENGVCVDSSH